MLITPLTREGPVGPSCHEMAGGLIKTFLFCIECVHGGQHAVYYCFPGLGSDAVRHRAVCWFSYGKAKGEEAFTMTYPVY